MVIPTQNMSIRRRTYEISNTEAYRYNPDYCHVSLADYLEDTQVENIWLQRECVKDILEWSEASLKSDPEILVDEVGGFLLGKVAIGKNNIYDLVIENFIPAREVEAQSPIKLEIGIGPNLELAQAMETHPGSGLVGWFHTHPGHTPFLSTTDLACWHEPHYTRPFQVAIVLDSLTEGFDTGIFSRKANGAVNNKTDFSRWITWRDLKAQQPKKKRFSRLAKALKNLFGKRNAVK